ncbi:flagellar hook-length control protein FliK [Hansschlegelia beijingensis]|uniref:flagellar hook-length control protein FliK n=1 Tax=Hansschlegelia beijingensis TaxID=1133344 RepID=UPI00387F1E8A
MSATARHGEPNAPAAPADRAAAGSPTAASPQSSSGASPQVASAAVAAVATAIATNAGARRTRFEVRLDPDELGRVDVRLDIAHDGKVATRLIVDRPETLNLLRHDARELVRTLEQAGFQLPDTGLSFQLRDGRQDAWREQAAQAPVSRLSVEASDAPAEVAPAPYHRPTRIGAGGVDMTV